MSIVVGPRSSFSFRSGVGVSGSSSLRSTGGMHYSAVGGGRSSGSRTPSVYGGAGGYGTRISQSVSTFSMAAPTGEFALGGNGKLNMQNLNDRLATYIEKVRSLEAANHTLEVQIKEFYEKKSPVHGLDMTVYFSTIEDLRKQILSRLIEHHQITVQVDNARLAADDFREKYETELDIRMTVEADIARLRSVLDSLTLSRGDLEIQIEGLQEELIYMKKSHLEDLQLMREKQTGGVNVEMDCAASTDLNMKLQEMRTQYEAMVQKNQKDAEAWFQSKVNVLQTQIVTSTTEVKTFQSELTELKRTFQNLEIELQGLLTQKHNMEQSAAEVNGRYAAHLRRLQLHINSLEGELQQVTVSIQQQASEYQLLLNIKMRLELEIAEYRRLLDGELHSMAIVSKTVVKTVETVQKVEETVEEVEEKYNPHLQRRVKIIVEDIVDGKVVSSKSDEKVEELS